MTETLFGAVEAGGTKFLCAVGSGPDDLRAEQVIPTTTPQQTLTTVLKFFAEAQQAHGAVAGFGVASFGPVDLDRDSATWGYITATPKAGWNQTDLAGPLKRAFGHPVAFDTDVNGAAVGEALWGAGKNVNSVAYVTVGTGIGGGISLAGKPLRGLLHPEMGHIRVRRHAADSYAGCCPFHGDCLEGLASGPAIVARSGALLSQLPEDHEAWDIEAFYIAQLLYTITCVVSPHRVILGGGAGGHPAVLDKTRQALHDLLGAYHRVEPLVSRLDEYVVAPSLGGRSGLLGALRLAQLEAGSSSR